MDVKQASKLLGWSKKYLISFQGILNVCEIVICYASIRLLWDTCRPAYSLSVGGFVGSAQETYFYISTWTCLILSSILLISFTVSHVSCILLERTIIGVMFWLTAFILSFITGLLLFLFVSVPKPVEIFGYSHKLGASILGLINSGLFAISAAKSYRACKSNWSYQFLTITLPCENKFCVSRTENLFLLATNIAKRDSFSLMSYSPIFVVLTVSVAHICRIGLFVCCVSTRKH